MNRNIVNIYALLFIMLSSVVLITDCCSSRSMPKSRPRPVSHFRGVITTSSATKIMTTSTNGGGGGGGSRGVGGGPLGDLHLSSSSSSATFTVITTKTAISESSGGASETISTVTDPRWTSGPGPGGGGGRGGGFGLGVGVSSSSGSSSSSNNGRSGESGSSSDGGKPDQLMRMGKCSLLFEENYCLNGGKCYNFTIANSTMPTCQCADGFMGERCESKYHDGTYLSMRKSKIHIETASIYYGAFLALIVVLVLVYFLHCFQSTTATIIVSPSPLPTLALGARLFLKSTSSSSSIASSKKKLIS